MERTQAVEEYSGLPESQLWRDVMGEEYVLWASWELALKRPHPHAAWQRPGQPEHSLSESLPPTVVEQSSAE